MYVSPDNIGHRNNRPRQNRERVVDGNTWSTLDRCPDQTLMEAFNLDKASFPSFLTKNWTEGQFMQLLKTFRENHVIFFDASGENILAAGFSAPIHLADKKLPVNGWEGGVQQIISNHQKGEKPNALMAFSASVSQDARGRGMGEKILKFFMQRAKALGFSKLIVPVRPNGKSRHPEMSMGEYLDSYDEKTGEHIDPWVKVHQRCGGKIVGVGKDSHVVRSADGSWPSVKQWEEWTEMKFPEDGEYDIPRGNAKLIIHDGVGEYRENCIWVEYDIS